MFPGHLRENRGLLHARLGDGMNSIWRYAVQGEDGPNDIAPWYSGAHSAVLALVGDDPIVFVNLRGKPEEGDSDGFTVGADVFTETLVVTVTATRVGEGEVSWTVKAVGRSTIVSVEADATTDAFLADHTEWPRMRYAILTFQDDRKLVLAPNTANQEGRDELAKFVRSVAAGLA